MSFGKRLYTNIPEDLFSNIKVKKNKDYKEFKIIINNNEQTTSFTSRQVSDLCVGFNVCDGRCKGVCDECTSCQSIRCYSFGGTTTPGDSGGSEGGNGDSGSTGGGSSGGGSTTSSPWYLMNPDVDIYKYPSNIRSLFKRLTDYDVILQRQQLDYLKTNAILIQKLEAFLTNNNLEKSKFANVTIDVFMDNGDKDFFNWAIDYLIQNPNVTIGQFQNWFMSTPEGLDGEYDADFWENPNLTFQQQNLPKFNDFLLNYPSHTDASYTTPSKMYNSVGGMPLSIYNANPVKNGNTCAIRVSKALNYSGVIIPNIPNKTFKGNDGKYYFLGAANLMVWMKKTFATPTGSNHLTGAQGGVNGVNFPTLLKGKQGIYILIPNDTGISGFRATGHADLFFADGCDGGCYFGATGGVKEIFFWELK